MRGVLQVNPFNGSNLYHYRFYLVARVDGDRTWVDEGSTYWPSDMCSIIKKELYV